MTNGDPMVVVDGLVKRYGTRTVLDGVSLTIRGGELVALLGPNGAGKTTTVEIVEGYRRADGGSARVLGVDPASGGPALRARVGLMLQGGGIDPRARPRETLEQYGRFHADPRDADELLALVGLTTVAGTRYRRLSGGERQRLGLALALVGRPEVVVLDEPTAGMDPEARATTRAIVADLSAGATPRLRFRLDRALSMSDVDALGRAVADARPGARVVTDGDGARYRLDGSPPDAALVAAIAAWCATADRLIVELRTSGGSLEDVYLELVGGARASTAAEPAAGDEP